MPELPPEIEGEKGQAPKEAKGQEECLRKGVMYIIPKEIGTQLTTHDLYLRWQWIKMMEEVGAEGTQTIYVPTEGNLPILEAGRLKK
jgi:hypothetical protein